jgi:hypothetical protein
MSTRNVKLLVAMVALVLCTAASPPKQAELPLTAMKVAVALGKTGAPVEVRYEPTGNTLRGQPTTLKLAFVPQIAGSDLQVEFPASEAVSIDSVVSRMSVSKAERDGVYRRSIIVTPRLADNADLRVMVWVDAEGGRYFSIFTVPVGK